MYAHMNHTMIHALEAARREAADRGTPRPARAAPDPGALRLAMARTLVRAGERLAPEAVGPTPATSTPC